MQVPFDFLVIELNTAETIDDREALLNAVAVWNATQPVWNAKAPRVLLAIGGYDDDPRALWEIPEVLGFVMAWMREVKLDITDPRLYEDSRRVLFNVAHAAAHMPEGPAKQKYFDVFFKVLGA